MLFEAGNQKFCCIQTVSKGKANNTYVCYEMGVQPQIFYTLVEVIDRDVAKIMVKILNDVQEKNICSLVFAQGEHLCFLFPYMAKRPIETFFMSDIRSQHECEEITLHLVMECLEQEKQLPYPLLELILKQKNVNLRQDGSVYFTYALDLRKINPDCGEQQCVAALANLMARLKRQDVRSGAFELIQRKVFRGAYTTFLELYHDICITSAPEKKASILKRFLQFLKSKRRVMVRVLFIFSIILIILAVISLVSQLIFGQSFFSRLLHNAFEMIGTEHMTT